MPALSKTLLVLLSCIALQTAAMDSQHGERPNVLLILADDLGWNDVGYHGSEIRTPNLDELAAHGVVLKQFHSQPTCSPTRAALMTGKSPQRLGIYRQFAKNATKGLPEGEKTLADYLRQSGYQTWLVGKWHLGYAEPKYHPNARGFDHYYGHVTGGIGYWDHVHGGGYDWQRNGETVRESGYSTHLIRDEAIMLIKQREAHKPFFLYTSFNAPHLPNEAPQQTIDSYETVSNPFRRIHAAMVTELDNAIGEIVEVLREEGELSNTIIWFMSDNGGLNPNAIPNPGFVELSRTLEDWFGAPLPIQIFEFIRTNSLEGGSDNTPLRHGKGSIYEGGSRVPSLVYWPGRLEPTETKAFITVQDVLPTIVSALDQPVPEGLDGSDRVAALFGRETSAPNDYVTKAQFDEQAYYQWPWKLIATEDRLELYNLESDPLEQNNLAADQPERVVELQTRLANIPRGENVHIPTYRVFLDPDLFGGEEDREPWAERTIP